jgi:hypothetical protein
MKLIVPSDPRGSYLRMIIQTPDNIKSFEKYLNRLKISGIAIPGYLEKKINIMLQ